MSTETMTSDRCRRCGRHVGFVGRGLDFLFGCRGPARVRAAETAAPAAPAPVGNPKIRLEGFPLFEREKKA